MTDWREWLWRLDEWAVCTAIFSIGVATISVGVAVVCMIASQAIQLALRWCR